MKALLAPIFSLVMALAVLASLGDAPVTNSQAVQQARLPGLADLLAQGPVCVAWTEMAGDSPMPHEGGLVFYLHNRLVYGSAWFQKAKFTKPWPLVAGVGSVTNDSIYIVFRNATNEPEHEFYNAACVFVYNPVTREFTCDFMQQADPFDGRVPGKARGRRVESPGQEFEPYVTAIMKKATETQAVAYGHNCAVLRHNMGKGEYALYINGQEYHFCCPSCMDVFQANPDVFMREPESEEP